MTPRMLSVPSRFSIRLGGLVVSLLLPFSGMAAGLSSVFTAPPYQLDETIVGIEDWEMVNKPDYPVHNDPAMAVLVSSPVFEKAQPTALSLKTLVKNMSVKQEELGDRLIIETQFAVSFNPSYDRWGGLSFRLGPSATSSPFSFGYDHEKEGSGGFFFQGAGDKVVFLPRQDIQENVSYKFVVHVDLGAGTFRLLVTCAGDPSFRHETKDISFQEGYTPIPANTRGLFMGNYRPSFMDALIDYIKITPE